MKRHALAIGAPREGPAGAPGGEDVDVERMTRMLRGRGFEVEELLGPAATRDGILAGYRRLIERAGSGDAAVVYFSGHGGVVIDAGPRTGGRSLPKRFQFIAPTDYALTTEDDFRGISAWELSLLLGRLTAKTDNVTVIFDCCHAAQMSRSHAATGAAPRAFPKPTRIAIARHYDWVCEHVGPIAGLSKMGNPRAVRLVACGEWQSAYPVLGADGRLTGALTDALLATLDGLGDAPVSWHAVGAAVRTRVLRENPAQRPFFDGPVRRRLFALDEIHTTPISIAREGDELRLDAGWISEVSVGDVYGVTGAGAAGFTADAAVARVKVERVAALHAIARPIAWSGGHAALPREAIVWPLELALARHAVRLDAFGAERVALEAAIARSARLRVAGSGKRAVGELRMRRGELLVFAGDGTRLDRGLLQWTPGAAIRQLDQLAAAQTLRELEGAHGLADEEVEIEWGTVHPGGVRIPRPAHGAALGLGDRIYLRLHNRAGRRRFAHVFNVGLRGKITLLSVLASAGIMLEPGEEELVGIAVDPADPASGFELCWPEDTPTDEPGIDTLMVIVTTQPADLRALETDDTAGMRGHARAAGSPLQRLVSQLHEGGRRSATETDPFFVVRRSYVLHPLAVSIAGPGFAIDEDPLAVHAALRPEVWVGGGGREARPIEIRLRQVSVERAVRIDALVCTRSADRARVYQARTFRFAPGAAVRDGDLLWCGPVRDLLDIYLWIGPDGPDGADGGGRGLAELLAPALVRRDVVEALGALVVRDDAARWSLAGGASMALARAAGELLGDAAPGTAGFLHTSFVAHERYGIGHQPASGLYRGNGVELGLSIEG